MEEDGGAPKRGRGVRKRACPDCALSLPNWNLDFFLSVQYCTALPPVLRYSLKALRVPRGVFERVDVWQS